jgi:hypothetical protein
MTTEEREQMNVVCARIQEEKDYAKFVALLRQLSELLERKEARFGRGASVRGWQRNRPWSIVPGTMKKVLTPVHPVESEKVLRMAIEYLPESQRNSAVRYLLIAYGRLGKAVLTSPFRDLNHLLEALSLAGISLEKDEERSLIRDDGFEEHCVSIISNVELCDSQFAVLGLKPVDEK